MLLSTSMLNGDSPGADVYLSHGCCDGSALIGLAAVLPLQSGEILWDCSATSSQTFWSLSLNWW